VRFTITEEQKEASKHAKERNDKETTETAVMTTASRERAKRYHEFSQQRKRRKHDCQVSLQLLDEAEM
jgi:hypothetical protein